MQVLDDFAAVGTLLLNLLGGCFRMPSGHHSSLKGSGDTLNNQQINGLPLFPSNQAWGRTGHPAEVSGEMALVGESC